MLIRMKGTFVANVLRIMLNLAVSFFFIVKKNIIKASAKCVNCKTDFLYYLKFAGVILVQFGLVLYGVK